MVSIKLGDEIPLSINKSEFLCVSTEHHFIYVKFKRLLFSSFLKSIEKNIVHRAFSTSYNSFLSVFVHICGLMLKHNLLLKLKIRFAEY